MERISSGQTFFIKRVFPVFWFGFLAVFQLIVLFSGAKKEPIFIVQPILMAAIGVFFYRKLLRGVADEVLDGGSFLLVRNGDVEERIQLDNVVNISLSQYANPKKLTMRLRKPGKFGDEIAFIPKTQFRLNPFSRDPLVEQLMSRIDRARQQDRSAA